MKIARGLMIVALPLVAACAGEEQRPGAATMEGDTAGMIAETAMVTSPAVPMDTGAAGGEATGITLRALNNSGVTGDARLAARGEQTEVMVRLAGAAGQEQQGVHQGHIHTGTCDALGPVVVPLDPITTDVTGTGEMTATVDAALATIADGNHILVYHVAGGSPGQPISCGAIPAGGV